MSIEFLFKYFFDNTTLMQEPKKYTIISDEGPNNKTICRVLTNQGWFPIFAGYYKLVCGVPRKWWPLPDEEEGHFATFEAYRYELKDKIKRDLDVELVDGQPSDTIETAEVYEFEGQFDPEGIYWPQGAKAKVRFPGKTESDTIELVDWRFELYEGDKLYRISDQRSELVLSL